MVPLCAYLTPILIYLSNLNIDSVLLHPRQVEKELCPRETLFLYALLSVCVGEMHWISLLAHSVNSSVCEQAGIWWRRWAGWGRWEIWRGEWGVVYVSYIEDGQEHSFDSGLFTYVSEAGLAN